MGVLNSEVGYTPAMPRREDHEVHKDMWWEKKKVSHNNTECVCVSDMTSSWLVTTGALDTDHKPVNIRQWSEAGLNGYPAGRSKYLC